MVFQIRINKILAFFVLYSPVANQLFRIQIDHPLHLRLKLQGYKKRTLLAQFAYTLRCYLHNRWSSTNSSSDVASCLLFYRSTGFCSVFASSICIENVLRFIHIARTMQSGAMAAEQRRRYVFFRCQQKDSFSRSCGIWLRSFTSSYRTATAPFFLLLHFI